MSGCDYVKNEVRNVEERLKHSTGMGSSNKVRTPMEVTCKPELDTSDLLQPEDITLYQGYIRLIHSEKELGEVDIYHEISILSSYNVSPRNCNLKALICIFAYLKKHETSSIVFDSKVTIIQDVKFNNVD